MTDPAPPVFSHAHTSASEPIPVLAAKGSSAAPALLPYMEVHRKPSQRPEPGDVSQSSTTLAAGIGLNPESLPESHSRTEPASAQPSVATPLERHSVPTHRISLDDLWRDPVVMAVATPAQQREPGQPPPPPLPSEGGLTSSWDLRRQRREERAEEERAKQRRAKQPPTAGGEGGGGTTVR